MSDIPPEWENELGGALHGALVLVAITREAGDAATREQFFGTVTQANAEGVELMLGGTRAGVRYRLPPDPTAFNRADPGRYRLQSTGETLDNPDFVSRWTITAGERWVRYPARCFRNSAALSTAPIFCAIATEIHRKRQNRNGGAWAPPFRCIQT